MGPLNAEEQAIGHGMDWEILKVQDMTDEEALNVYGDPKAFDEFWIYRTEECPDLTEGVYIAPDAKYHADRKRQTYRPAE